MPTHSHHHKQLAKHLPTFSGILCWPSWKRICAVLPVVALLWLAVLWANLEQAPW